MSNWKQELFWLWMGWRLVEEQKKVNGKTITQRGIEHQDGDRERGVVMYDAPPGSRFWNIVFRVPWIKRTRNPNYKVPMLISEGGTTRTNPLWDRDQAYPVLR